MELLTAKRIFDLVEEALLVLVETVLAQHFTQLLEHGTLFVVQSLGDLDLDCYQLVAAPGTSKPWDTLIPQGEHLSWLGSCWNVHFSIAVQGWDNDGGSQRRLENTDGLSIVDVDTVAGEYLVGPDPHQNVEVARATAVGPGLTLMAQTDLGAVFNSRWYRDHQPAVPAFAPCSPALPAWVGDGGAQALTGVTGGYLVELCEQALLRAPDLT